MEETQLRALHRQYFNLIPLFYKCKTFYIDKNKTDYLCNRNQTMAIMLIGKAEKIMTTELSQYIKMEKGSLTTLIDSLVEKGLVIRSGDPKDRRKVLLSLTPEGINYMQTTEEQSLRGLGMMLAGLSAEEIGGVYTSLNTLVDALRKIADGVK